MEEKCPVEEKESGEMAKEKTTYKKVVTDFGTGFIENNVDNTFQIKITDTDDQEHLITIDEKYLENLRDAAIASYAAWQSGYDVVTEPY